MEVISWETEIWLLLLLQESGNTLVSIFRPLLRATVPDVCCRRRFLPQWLATDRFGRIVPRHTFPYTFIVCTALQSLAHRMPPRIAHRMLPCIALHFCCWYYGVDKMFLMSIDIINYIQLRRLHQSCMLPPLDRYHYKITLVIWKCQI
jgi:hypothetical protein